jgi:hypothetical protein
VGSTSMNAPNGCSRVTSPLIVAPITSCFTAWPHGSSMSDLIDSEMRGRLPSVASSIDLTWTSSS